jgi:hypothetical protein
LFGIEPGKLQSRLMECIELLLLNYLGSNIPNQNDQMRDSAIRVKHRADVGFKERPIRSIRAVQPHGGWMALSGGGEWIATVGCDYHPAQSSQEGKTNRIAAGGLLKYGVRPGDGAVWVQNGKSLVDVVENEFIGSESVEQSGNVFRPRQHGCDPTVCKSPHNFGGI